VDTALQNLENSLEEAVSVIDHLAAENARLRASLTKADERMHQASTRLRALADQLPAEIVA
jgi:predicted  nucleic acid-binding Zn-ribbon protein